MLSYRIRQARKLKGLSQEQLAEELHKSRTAIVNWETGYARPDQETLPLIATALDVSLEWLLDSSNDEFEMMEVKVNQEDQVITNAQRIGARLRYYRKRKGLKGDEVAKYLNVSRTAISNYETGNREPNFDTVILLSELYDMSADNLLGISSSFNKDLDSGTWIYELLAADHDKQEAMRKIWDTIRDL